MIFIGAFRQLARSSVPPRLRPFVAEQARFDHIAKFVISVHRTRLHLTYLAPRSEFRWSERVQEMGEGPTLPGVLAAAAEARETLVELQVSVADRIKEAASHLAAARAAVTANKHDPAALVHHSVLQHVLGRYVRELDTIRRVLAPPADK